MGKGHFPPHTTPLASPGHHRRQPLGEPPSVTTPEHNEFPGFDQEGTPHLTLSILSQMCLSQVRDRRPVRLITAEAALGPAVCTARLAARGRNLRSPHGLRDQRPRPPVPYGGPSQPRRFPDRQARQPWKRQRSRLGPKPQIPCPTSPVIAPPPGAAILWRLPKGTPGLRAAGFGRARPTQPGLKN